MANLRKLVDGYQRFKANYFGESSRRLYAELAQGQHPDVLVIACSDSRVDPAIVMDCKPGDLFVVRNVASLVPPYEKGGMHHGVSAALEYAVSILQVSNIVVLGHRQCGGIQALLSGMPDGLEGEFIKPWVDMAKGAVDRACAEHHADGDRERACHCEQAGIMVSLENLRTFPFVQAQLAAKKLRLHGWYFDIETGEMMAYDPARQAFVALMDSSELASGPTVRS